MPILAPIEPEKELVESTPEWQDALADVRHHLSACRDLPGLDRFHETGQLPRAFIDHYAAAMAAYDRMIDVALANDPPERRIQCKKGCSNCCVDLVRGITTSEIVYLYNTVRWRDDCKQLFDYHSESAKAFSMILMGKGDQGEEVPDGRDPRVAEAHVEYNQLNRPCGFLDQQTGACSIYEVRPIACRYFFSVDPPETCSPKSERYLTRATRTVHLPEEIHALLREIDHRFGFRPLNYLSGGFCQFTANVMKLKVIELVD